MTHAEQEKLFVAARRFDGVAKILRPMAVQIPEVRRVADAYEDCARVMRGIAAGAEIEELFDPWRIEEDAARER